jgi:hypothetical protein
MSDPATAPTTVDQIVAGLSDALPVLETVLGVMLPGSTAALAIGVKIAQGVAAAVPEAEKLYAQFQSSTPPTTAELDAYAVGEQSAYETLMADIKAKQAAS